LPDGACASRSGSYTLKGKNIEVVMSQLLIMLVILIGGLLPIAAATPGDNYIIFTWNGVLFAHSLQTGAVTRLGPADADITATLPGQDVYTLKAGSFLEPSPDGYGFHHGVWSPDRTQLAYLEIAPPRYRVRLQSIEGNNQLLLDDQLSAARGYLDPVAWTAQGELVLLERVLLNHLHTVNIWWLDPATLTLEYHAYVPLERLSGRSALLPDRTTVFLGYNVEQQVGYLLDITSGQAQMFSAQLGQVLPPVYGFEYYALPVLGALSADDLASLTEHLKVENTAAATLVQPPPFLHWPLPDEARSITCYPDTAWTTANFDVTCPGLSSPRNYVGHQGTDIGGKPDGLPLGTPVYPSAPGVVVATYRECLADNPSCNHAYGNTITMEHVLLVNGETQVWYTGYGHLQTVLVEDYAYLGDVTEPLALSGATGDGGLHLHFEVSSPDHWVNPWDNRAGDSLWLGSNAHPEAAVSPNTANPIPQVLAVCTSFAGNNIRSGPGTTYEIVGETAQDTTYSVLEITFVGSGAAPGDWYRVLFEGGEGWLWSGLLNCP
jgi:murein DD-endopeptidase MepM/ murein hydrolase activator NlpD